MVLKRQAYKLPRQRLSTMLQINLCSTLSRFLYQEYLLEREALFQHS